MAVPVLQFALGLTGTPFLTTLNGVGLAVNQFTVQISKAFSGVMQQISRGADLDALSRRTGVAAGALYQLQESFKQVDADAGAVPTALNFLQRSLSGVTETGESAQAAISALGLSVDDLKKMRPEQAFQAVVNAMGKMGQSDALSVGQTLFGRGGGQTAVMISRSLEEFNAAMADTASGGALFNRSAQAMNDLLDTFTRLDRKTKEWVAVIAEQALPGLQAVAKWVGKIDLKPLATSVGQWIGGFAASIGSGKLTQVMELSLTAGFEAFINSATVLWTGFVEGLASLLAKSIGDPGKFAANVASRASGFANLNLFAASPLAGLAALFGRRKLAEYGEDAGGGDLSAESASASIMEGVAAAREKAKGMKSPAAEALAKLLAALNPAATPPTTTAPGEGTDFAATAFPGGLNSAAMGSGAGLNALERIGAIFGAGTSSQDYQKKIADNTAEMVKLLNPRNRPAGEPTPFSRA